MRRLMTTALPQSVLLFCLVLSLVIVGDIQAAKAQNNLTVEGIWEVMSANPLTDVSRGDLGQRLSIVRKGNTFDVKWLTGQRAELPSSSVFTGSVMQISHGSQRPIWAGTWVAGEARGDSEPANLAQQVAGITYTKTVSYTLSNDGHTLQRCEDAVRIHWSKGRYTHHEVTPCYFKETFKRVSGPQKAPAPKPLTSAVAQVESRGEFYVLTKDGRKLTGKEASQIPLEEGTKVITGSNGHIRMKLPDETTFTVGPNSDIAIDSFVYDPDNTPKKVIANMSKGVFRWVTGKIKPLPDPAEMKVKLPVVAVGIRGTDFEVAVKPDGSGSVVLHFGQLEITENKTGFKFILDAGYKVTFKADGSVSRPMKAD